MTNAAYAIMKKEMDAKGAAVPRSVVAYGFRFLLAALAVSDEDRIKEEFKPWMRERLPTDIVHYIDTKDYISADSCLYTYMTDNGRW